MSANTKENLIYLAVLKLYKNDDCRCITHLDSTQIKIYQIKKYSVFLFFFK